MTPSQKIRAVLKEREERKQRPYNITQLADAMGKARESVSRRVNGKTTVTGEYPELFAKALGIDPAELRSPAVEVVSLESLDTRRAALEARIERMIGLTEDALRLLRAARKRGTQAA